MSTRTYRREPTKVSSTTLTNGDARQALINRSIALTFLDLDKHLAWNGGYSLTGLSVTSKDDGWQAVIKARRNGGQWVAFVMGGTYSEAIELAAEFADRGVLTWMRDKWPSRRK